jgi:hypothetical protein
MKMKRKYRIKLYRCKDYEPNVDKFMLAKRYEYKFIPLITLKFNYELIPIATIALIIAFSTYLQM